MLSQSSKRLPDRTIAYTQGREKGNTQPCGRCLCIMPQSSEFNQCQPPAYTSSFRFSLALAVGHRAIFRCFFETESPKKSHSKTGRKARGGKIDQKHRLAGHHDVSEVHVPPTSSKRTYTVHLDFMLILHDATKFCSALW